MAKFGFAACNIQLREDYRLEKMFGRADKRVSMPKKKLLLKVFSFVRAMCLDVSVENPIEIFNPVLIHGGHLLYRRWAAETSS